MHHLYERERRQRTTNILPRLLDQKNPYGLNHTNNLRWNAAWLNALQPEKSMFDIGSRKSANTAYFTGTSVQQLIETFHWKVHPFIHRQIYSWPLRKNSRINQWRVKPSNKMLKATEAKNCNRKGVSPLSRAWLFVKLENYNNNNNNTVSTILQAIIWKLSLTPYELSTMNLICSCVNWVNTDSTEGPNRTHMHKAPFYKRAFSSLIIWGNELKNIYFHIFRINQMWATVSWAVFTFWSPFTLLHPFV